MGLLGRAVVRGDAGDVVPYLRCQPLPAGDGQRPQRRDLARQVLALQHVGPAFLCARRQRVHAGACQQAGILVSAVAGCGIDGIGLHRQGQPSGQLHAAVPQHGVGGSEQPRAGVGFAMEPQGIAHGVGVLGQQCFDECEARASVRLVVFGQHGSHEGCAGLVFCRCCCGGLCSGFQAGGPIVAADRKQGVQPLVHGLEGADSMAAAQQTRAAAVGADGDAHLPGQHAGQRRRGDRGNRGHRLESEACTGHAAP